ncbi:ABC transporter ATP-binding protein [Streptomyces sp. URMC 126]|uniref:ABC transporter ATP-binding protein n=1 Tax=Streptomyces sp. URMC 126 TaxID=3423401 RepID=UPI003F1B6C79
MESGECVIEAAGLWRVHGRAGRSGRVGGADGSAGVEAVRGIGFTVRRGEVFALLGADGAGKTSTVELLAGLAPPTGGRVTVLGHDPYAQRRRVRSRIGVLLQEDGLPSGLTAGEAAVMWAGCTSGARPVDEALDLAGLGARRNVRLGRLSGDERRRLALSVALLGRPEVLVLDEPTAGLGPWARRAVVELVHRLRAEGTTVVLTARRLEEAEALAGRLAVMSGGRIVVEGTPSEVRAAYPSRIRFAMPPGWFVGDLPPLGALGVVGHRELPDGSGRVELLTPELQRTLTGLLIWARERAVELEGLDVRTASPEEAFPEPGEGDAAGVRCGTEAG